MEIVLTATSLDAPGGVQTYALGTATHLERLGHEVTLYAPVQGVMAEAARALGLRVARAEHRLPASCDAILAQDAPTLLAAAERYPDAVRGLVIHGAEYDVHLPPPPAGAASVVIALNDATAARARAVADAPPVVRLRQPIDLGHFRPRGGLPEAPRRVLVLGNEFVGPRRDELRAACERAGVTLTEVGRYGGAVPDPVAEICAADVVVGRGRSLLEAMACGRAAYLMAPGAGDGWVTPESYPAIEADGFRGWATGTVADAREFDTALAGYRRIMGEANRSLVFQHHRLFEHAVDLVEALGAVSPRPLGNAPLRELARLVRVAFNAEARAEEYTRELAIAHARADRLAEELDVARAGRPS